MTALPYSMTFSASFTDSAKRAVARPPERVAILVVGVGRSGTSALARVLSLRGAALPKDVLGPGRGNERGHWEPAALAHLNDQILRKYERNWWLPEPMPAEWFRTPEAEIATRRAEAIIDEQYGAAPLFVIKEPRLCVLAPITLAALARLGIQPRIVMPIRHPAEVASSIWYRDNTQSSRGEWLWIRHILEAEAVSRPYRRAWTTFDDILGDWRSTSQEIGQALDIAWPVTTERAEAEVEAFLAPHLRHFDAKRRALPLSVGPLAQRLWAAAERAPSGDDAALRATFDDVRMVIAEMDRLRARG